MDPKDVGLEQTLELTIPPFANMMMTPGLVQQEGAKTIAEYLHVLNVMVASKALSVDFAMTVEVALPLTLPKLDRGAETCVAMTTES